MSQASPADRDDPGPPPSACATCLRRTWLVARLAGHIGIALSERRGVPGVMALSDRELVEALAGRDRGAVRRGYAAFDSGAAQRRAARAGLQTTCRHQPGYPARLAEMPDAPAVLHVRGGLGRLTELAGGRTIAIVGARRATPQGLEIARGLGRGLASAGVTVVSGMALGVDAAAHDGALATGSTIAVLAGGADRPYPPSKRGLWERIARGGAVVSEFPPGFVARRWGFPARNRIIAGLAELTVVVEATQRSGALITAGLARELGREVAAVPGPVASNASAGTNALLYDGAHLVRDAQDALDLLLGAGVARAPRGPAPEEVPPPLRKLLDGVGRGQDTLAAVVRAGMSADEAMAGLAELELLGHVRRGVGGRYVRVS